MDILNVHEHEHPLKLIDLQIEYPHYEEGEEDDDGEMIAVEGFRGECDRCRHEIHMYHRYYYKCLVDSSCDVSLHKFCAELPRRLEHPLHRHPLILQSRLSYWRCNSCNSRHKPLEMYYFCSSCRFAICLNSVMQSGKKIIHHPCHTHPLECCISKPILCECNACGKRHEGIFYRCTTCISFTIHSECAFLPKTLLIQHTTDDAFYHTHPLTISYSFPVKDQKAKFYPRCRVCGRDFYQKGDLWIYKCDQCMYYAHLDCATSRGEPFMSIFLSAGTGRTIKNFKDIDHPHILHLPFPDETYSIPRHLFFQEGVTSDKVNPKHMSHEHPLVLVDPTQCDGQTYSENKYWLSMCHNPMKKTQLLCDGCLKPIMSSMPFYICSQRCNFSLHEWCSRLPPKIENHADHPQHTIFLMYSNVLPFFFGVFYCAVCNLPCNGFAYCCVECKYYVDVTCGFMPKEITHKAHPNHLLSIVKNRGTDRCHICRYYFYWRLPSHPLSYGCNMCDIDIHLRCALLLVETIIHKYDKHPLQLSYFPIENHKSEYFCEICEEPMNPQRSFYHCRDCIQSMHVACAPLVPPCKIDFRKSCLDMVNLFVNIKFGGIYNNSAHPHPLSFARGFSSVKCSICSEETSHAMIFKCLECKFAIDYDCCRSKYGK